MRFSLPLSSRCLSYIAAIALSVLALAEGTAGTSTTAETRGLPAALGADDTVPGEILTASTLERIGVRWFIDGDENLDCAVGVEYRRQNAQEDWRPAQSLLRVEPGSFNGNGVDPGNLLAGSVFGQAPATVYELRLSLLDPDGGSAVETLLVETRAVPEDAIDPRIRYVVPGDGGGSGSENDPFRGLAEANAAAVPGDLFLLGSGTYTGTSPLTAQGTQDSPIVFRGEDVESVVLDGEGTAKPVVDLSGSRYLHLENVTIRRPRQMAVRAYETVGLVIRNCIIDSSDPTGYEMGGIYLLGSGHQDALISGNVIRGPIDWEEGRIEDAYGLIVVGSGHVIRYNEIYNWWDGVCVGGDDSTVETSECDVYSNEIYNCTDDGIETDGSRHNIYVYRNRITNVLVGLSCQPVYGGPVYMIRNVVYNWQLKPLKFHVWPTGMVVYHNTFVGADPRGWGGGDWRNAIVRNNLFIGGSESGPTGDPIPLETNGIRADLDFNGWYQAEPSRFAYFNGVFYPTLESFQDGTGMEEEAVLLDIGTFLDAEEPPLGSFLGQDGFPPPYQPGSQDLRLRAGSGAVDAGEHLPNVNDGLLGLTADLGAYERGLAVPPYGPGAALSALVADKVGSAGGVRLHPGVPNPFDRRVTVAYELPGQARVSAEIYGVSGRLVRNLLQGAHRGSGRHQITWNGLDENGRNVGSGVYFLRLRTGDVTAIRKVVLAHK